MQMTSELFVPETEFCSCAVPEAEIVMVQTGAAAVAEVAVNIPANNAEMVRAAVAILFISSPW